MTESTTQAQQAPAFPIHKSIWSEITDYLGKLPYKISGALHGVAKRGLDESVPTDSHVNVAPEFLTHVINTLADQPAHEVGALLEKVTNHIQETNNYIQAVAQAQQDANTTAAAQIPAAPVVTEANVPATGTVEVVPTATPVDAPVATTTDVVAVTTTDVPAIASVDAPVVTSAA